MVGESAAARARGHQPARQRRQVEPRRRARSRSAVAGGVLTVDDEGPGIAEGDLPHVFERFYRAEESRTMPGSGLGLSIVRQVAERHAGTVEAARRTTGGTRFTVRLPGTPAQQDAPVPTP